MLLGLLLWVSALTAQQICQIAVTEFTIKEFYDSQSDRIVRSGQINIKTYADGDQMASTTFSIFYNDKYTDAVAIQEVIPKLGYKTIAIAFGRHLKVPFEYLKPAKVEIRIRNSAGITTCSETLLSIHPAGLRDVNAPLQQPLTRSELQKVHESLQFGERVSGIYVKRAVVPRVVLQNTEMIDFYQDLLKRAQIITFLLTGSDQMNLEMLMHFPQLAYESKRAHCFGWKHQYCQRKFYKDHFKYYIQDHGAAKKWILISA